MVYSNAVTTVSPGYANEAMTGGAAGFLYATLAQPHIRSKFQACTDFLQARPCRFCIAPAARR